jgi:imidazoleglycerol-phosphate dehydratase
VKTQKKGNIPVADSAREARIERNTNETQISIRLRVDGEGRYSGSFGVPFFEHMLNLFARHSMMDIEIEAQGDIEIDAHHLVEDIGIVLGQVLKSALGDKRAIARYGEAYVPMEETLARCVLDVCNRAYFRLDAAIPKAKVGTFDSELAEEFFRAFANNAGITMHLAVFYGSNVHHLLEAMFKATGRALGKAVVTDPRIQGVLSTKGTI